jgi:nitrile hydratase
MTDDKVSRRDFLTNTSLAAGTAVASSAAGHVHAQDAPEHAQSDYSVRAKALVSVLTKKNLINPATMDAVVEFYETQVGPHIGARLVARSWLDPEFRARLLADARAVARDERLTGLQGTDLVAVENTPAVHNLVVCTLCSCYPWTVLGLPPTWYKDTGYRARAVIDPRGVLEEFGLELDDGVEVRVWDSTAEIRYLVIPERPSGTEGLSEEELARLITRDSMVGAEKLHAPAQLEGRR